MTYVGRFAPSPSGPLHFGSLVCALASFLHARQHNGKWLLRIEDIDTPRVDESMSKVIMSSLHAHGLEWDTSVSFQSERHELYHQHLQKLQKLNFIYACACSRKQIKARSGFYDGFCRQRDIDYSLIHNQHAIRFKHQTDNSQFTDLFWGPQQVVHPIAHEDPVLKRADGIYAYHLAVVADDIEQKITHIVRGKDLLETTPVHLSLYQAFNANAPSYLHIPVVTQKPNQKLSKQHHSPAIKDDDAISNLKLALIYLGISRDLQPQFGSIEALLMWAIEHWSYKLIAKQPELLISIKDGVYSSP